MKHRSQTLTSLRALLDLALYSAPEVPSSLAAIARRQGLSAAFLEQLFRRLKASGLVKPSRGMKGGYVLSRPPAEITLLEVYQSLGDPGVRSTNTVNERAETEVLLEHLEAAGKKFENSLKVVTLEDLRQKAQAHPRLPNAPQSGAGFNI